MRHLDNAITLFVCCFVFPLEILFNRIPTSFSITCKGDNMAVIAGSQKFQVDTFYALSLGIGKRLTFNMFFS